MWSSPSATSSRPACEMIMAAADVIEPDQNRVKLADGRILNYDFLVIATGTQTHPEADARPARRHEWHKSIFDFYTIEGALALAKHLRTWQGGRLVRQRRREPDQVPGRAAGVHHAGRLVLPRAGHPRPGGADLRHAAVGRVHQAHRRQAPGRHPGAEEHQGRARVHGRARGSRTPRSWCTTTRPSWSTICWSPCR